MTKEEAIKKFPVGSKIINCDDGKGEVVYHGRKEMVVEYTVIGIVYYRYDGDSINEVKLVPKEYWIPWYIRGQFVYGGMCYGSFEECEQGINTLTCPSNFIPMQIFPPTES